MELLLLFLFATQGVVFAKISEELTKLTKLTLEAEYEDYTPTGRTICTIDVNPEYVEDQYGAVLIIPRETIWNGFQIFEDVVIKKIKVISYETKDNDGTWKLDFHDREYYFWTYFFKPAPKGETFGTYEVVYFTHSGCGGTHRGIPKAVTKDGKPMIAFDPKLKWNYEELRRHDESICYSTDDSGIGPFVNFSVYLRSIKK